MAMEMSISTYGRILQEVERLIRIGAVEKRGRPPVDSATPKFRMQNRVWKKAIQSLPPAERSEWEQLVKRSAAELSLGRRYLAKMAAASLRGDTAVLGRLLQQTQKNKDAKNLRMLTINAAMIALEKSGSRVTSKTVARQLESAGEPTPKLDTIRKLIAQIRQGRTRG